MIISKCLICLGFFGLEVVLYNETLKDMGGDGARGETNIRVSRMEDSDEGVLTHQGVGIMGRTDYIVLRDDQR